MSTVPTTCDLLIHSGDVIDGTGVARAHLDVAVTGDRIVAVGEHLDLRRSTLGAHRGAGVHRPRNTHDDRAVLTGPDMTPKVSQGVTSVVTGNCGPASLRSRGREPPPPMNLLGECVLVPVPDHARVHGCRGGVASGPQSRAAGRPYRVAGRDDGRRLPRRHRGRDRAHGDAARRGAGGGLHRHEHRPCLPARGRSTDRRGRDPWRAGWVRAAAFTRPTCATRERGSSIRYARRSRSVSGPAFPWSSRTTSAAGRESWGLSRETLATIAHARAKQSVNLDVYPYVASSTVLLVDWIAGAERVLVTWSAPHPELKGRDFEDIRAEWGCSVEEAVERLSPAGANLLQDGRRGSAAHPALPGRDDRLRRPPARHLSPPPAVGHVSQGARSLLPGASACSLSKRPSIA